MNTNMMDQKVKELRELKRMQEELAAEIEAIRDELKTHMDARGMDTLLGFDWKVTWKSVTSSRLYTTALKKELPSFPRSFWSCLLIRMLPASKSIQSQVRPQTSPRRIPVNTSVR